VRALLLLLVLAGCREAPRAPTRAEVAARLGAQPTLPGPIVLPAEDALATLTAAWGPPREGYGADGRPLYLWWRPVVGVRARFDPAQDRDPVQVEIEEYTPLRQLLGSYGPLLQFEQRSLVGRRLGEIWREYGERYGGAQLELTTPTDWDPHRVTVVSLHTGDTTEVVGFELFIDYGADGRDQVRDLLEQRFGPGIREPAGLRFFLAGRVIIARDDPTHHQWVLSFWGA